MTVRIQIEDFDVGLELNKMRLANPSIGAVASFIGQVRDINDNDMVNTLTLEHYAGMTEKSLVTIEAEAKNRWHIIDSLIIHRVGTLQPLDQIVFVGVTSSHRGDAFKACEFIMDFLKTQAPFWKKEMTNAGERWVEAKLADDDATARWNK